MRESDVDRAYAAHVDIANRGAYFPLGVLSEPAFRREFAETGFWEREEGMLLVVESGRRPASGHIEFFKPVSYWDAFELSYQLYDERSRRTRLRQRGRPAARRLPVRDQEAAPHPPRHRPGERRVPPGRGEVRVRSRGHRPGGVLQRRPQPGRGALLAAQDRPAALAPGSAAGGSRIGDGLTSTTREPSRPTGHEGVWTHRGRPCGRWPTCRTTVRSRIRGATS